MIAKEEKELVPQLRFPAGYHFRPTDEELLDVYLRAKIDGREPPLDVFMDVDILDWDPAELVEKRKAYGEGRYFFTKRTECPANKNGEPRRKLYKVKASWKATGCPGIIYRSATGEKIGTKRILTYYSGGVECDKWSMNEYVMTGRAGLDQWILCTIQEKLHWEAKSSKHAAGKMAEDTSSKGKTVATGARKVPKTKRQKKEKMDPSQPHKTQEQLQQPQQKQETTPDVFSEPPTMFTSDHHALHEEEIMEQDFTTKMIQVVVQQEHPYGDQHYLDAPAPQETTYEGPGEPPLKPHHQHGYHAWLEEQQHQELEDPFSVQHQFDPFNTMIFQGHTGQEPTPGWWQQHQPSYIDNYHQFFLPANGMEHASGCQLPHQQTLYPLGTPGSHGDFKPTSQHELQFPLDPAKPNEQQTSPDSVLGVCQHCQLTSADKVACSLCCCGGFNSEMK
ncbi:hypothetical protein CFC21_106279 [Triticum aestivum]|uniref:NAC domain-containing protein n=2 Tax=Triticum aestivum TaxID=4565 RepID=A0A3B6SUT1_WHEAT|nr:NAC domain-containing protein 43-like [Triticum aestivum]KAF7105470.1 hypothetical protein CFC21_106279 [Triticum aestivum]